MINPNSGVPSGGTVVEIEGTGFGHSEVGTAVRFGATPVSWFQVENDTLIRAITPAETIASARAQPAAPRPS